MHLQLFVSLSSLVSTNLNLCLKISTCLLVKRETHFSWFKARNCQRPSTNIKFYTIWPIHNEITTKCEITYFFLFQMSSTVSNYNNREQMCFYCTFKVFTEWNSRLTSSMIENFSTVCGCWNKNQKSFDLQKKVMIHALRYFNNQIDKRKICKSV